MVRAVRVAHLAIAVALAALGCNKGSAGQTATSASPSASAAPAAAASGAVRAPKNKPLAREKIDVPGGAFEAGSVPGSPGRNPELEPVAKQVDLGAYQIDRLPYPNDPGQPPLTAVTRDEAEREDRVELGVLDVSLVGEDLGGRQEALAIDPGNRLTAQNWAESLVHHLDADPAARCERAKEFAPAFRTKAAPLLTRGPELDRITAAIGECGISLADAAPE